MLTVKHIEDTGHENIYPAARVSYQPRQVLESVNVGPNTLAPCVFIDTPKGDTVPLGSFGVFYVMNEAGKTIAKYDMGAKPPLDEPKQYQAGAVTITNAANTATAWTHS